MDAFCRNAQIFKPGYLVLHQGDQGGYDEPDPNHQQRRHLVAHRFATPCGQQRKSVPVFQHTANDIPLQWPEAVITPVLF